MIFRLYFFVFFFLSFVEQVLAADESQKVVESIFGARKQEKFSFHRPSYFIFGKDDLKMQFSFKYRVARKVPVFLAHTQLIFWKIYDESKPFRDVTYNPEVFWRLIDKSENAFSTLDIGYAHLSNGKELVDSRSVDRVFARANYYTTLKDHQLLFNLMVYTHYNEDPTNKNIKDHLGYWELQLTAMDLIKFESSSIALELRTYAGKKLIDIDQGAFQTGLQWFFVSENFNPSIYLQRFDGYAENLLDYNKKTVQYRLGLHLRY